ncbi:MAG: histidine phosphatase family protein [Rikenellaceae bacterium]
MELIAIRHGETVANVARICQGQTQGKLTERGQNQAIVCGEKLSSETFDVIYCSDLERAVKTTELIFGCENLDTFIKDSRLRERYFGEFQDKELVGGFDYCKDIEGVESMADMYERVREFLEEIKGKHIGKKVVVVSHGITIRVITSIISGKSIYDIDRPDNCSIARFIL